MMKQGCLRLIGFIGLPLLLSGCWGGLWTGASLVYDRHNVYKKVDDYQLYARTAKVLNHDKKFECHDCYIDIAVFNGDVLVAGHLPSEDMQAEASERLNSVPGKRRLFNQIQISSGGSGAAIDSWLTTKIRGQMFIDDRIDPNTFKIVTVDQIVYLMGDVKSDEAEKVVRIARNTKGVLRVVKMMKYYTYESHNKVA